MKVHGFVASVLASLALVLTLGLVSPVSAGAVDGIGSSECLGMPTQAVSDWMFLYPCCFDENTCNDACENWVRTCNDYARVAYQCQLHSSRQLTDLFKGSECDTSSSKDDRKQCSKDAGNELRSVREYLDMDLSSAKENCVDAFFDCLDFCLD